MYFLVICIIQILLHVIGLFVGIGKAECEVSVHSGSDVEINCEYCIEHAYVSWQQVVLLIVGVAVILVGVFAGTTGFHCLLLTYFSPFPIKTNV